MQWGRVDCGCGGGGGGAKVSDIWSGGSAGVLFVELKEIWKIFGVKTIYDKRKQINKDRRE